MRVLVYAKIRGNGYHKVGEMAMRKFVFTTSIGIFAFSLIGIFLLLMLSIIFPVSVLGLSEEYVGLMGFLMHYYLEPLYWLLCAGIITSLCLFIYRKNDVTKKKLVLMVLMVWVSKAISHSQPWQPIFTMLKMSTQLLASIGRRYM